MKQDNITEEIVNFLKDRGWDNPSPGALAKSISIESSELLELFQWSDDSFMNLKENPEKLENLKDEIGDIIIYCIQITGLLGISYQDIVRTKLKKVKKKYPAKQMKNRDKKSIGGSDDLYLKIKKEERESKY